MENYASFLPRALEVPVGDKKIKVKEYTVAKRDAVVKVVLSDLDLSSALGPFMEAVRAAREGLQETTTVDLAAVLGQVRDLVLRLLGKDLTLISCLTLDTLENRQLVGIKDATAIETDEKDGYEYSPEMFAWVKSNLTQRQEFAVIEALVKVNDVAGLVKNYWTLASGILRMAGVGAEREAVEETTPTVQ